MDVLAKQTLNTFRYSSLLLSKIQQTTPACQWLFTVNRQLSHKDTYYVTTPIFYVNAAPHIGHLFCVLLADAAARWQSVKGKQTLFTTGTDEHGLKIQQAAATAGVLPQAYCDDVSSTFKSLFDQGNIQYDRFFRTTDPDHVQAVHAFWNKLSERGYIYKGSYTGWYSISDEAFLSEEDVEDSILADGSTAKVSKSSGHVVTWMEESNYKFKLANLQQDLLYWLKSGVIHPSQYEADVRRMIQTLPDLSVSRDKVRLTWGIPVPGDESQKIYVWLDALVNYLTVVGYPQSGPGLWPPTCQVIGKDILKFHAVYWPAFLIAAGLDPPPKLVCHAHWLVDNVKMSKSLGNVIDPVQKMSTFGVDGFRYFLLKEGSLSSDGTYSDKRVAERINTDLANTLGNLLGRCTAPSVNKKQELPSVEEDNLFEFFNQREREMFTAVYALPEKVGSLYEDFNYTKALELIMSHLHWANSLVQSHAPWQLAKSHDPQDHAHLLTVLHVAMETLRVCGILFQPIMPELSERLLTRLGVPPTLRFYHNACTPMAGNSLRLGDRIVLQKKVDVSE